jgi:hypothetical protein
VKRNSLFFVAFGIGHWDKSTLREMFNKVEDYVQQPTYYHKISVYSDGNNDYTSVLPEFYSQDCISYGQKIKSIGGKKVIPAIKRKVYGNPNLEDIDTNSNECFNSILRNRVSKLVRRSQCHAKVKRSLKNTLFLFQFYWNFMHQIQKKLTPAILEKQTSKVWTWGMFLHKPITFVT